MFFFEFLQCFSEIKNLEIKQETYKNKFLLDLFFDKLLQIIALSLLSIYLRLFFTSAHSGTDKNITLNCISF